MAWYQPTILLIGGSPPTDIGTEARPGILWNFRHPQHHVSAAGAKTGFHLAAVSPEFDTPEGWSDAALTVPYWGSGTGKFRANYRDYAVDFWNAVYRIRPVAIMSFSSDIAVKGWRLDKYSRNLSTSSSSIELRAGENSRAWRLQIPYFAEDVRPFVRHLEPPYPGGGPGDPSPIPAFWESRGYSQHLPAACYAPRAEGPPDNTRDVLATLASTLPLQMIHSEICKLETVDASLHSGPMDRCLAEYIAYLASWHQHSLGVRFSCLAAGHTTIGAALNTNVAKLCLQLQIDTLVSSLLESPPATAPWMTAGEADDREA